MKHALHAAGFTLLEMMVVLVLIGLLMGLVGPSFIHQIEQSQARDAHDRFVSELVQLPRWARVVGHSLQLEKLDKDLVISNESVLTVPQGWAIVFAPALSVSPRQLCTGSVATLQDTQGLVISSQKLRAPDCQVEESDT